MREVPWMALQESAVQPGAYSGAFSSRICRFAVSVGAPEADGVILLFGALDPYHQHMLIKPRPEKSFI